MHHYKLSRDTFDMLQSTFGTKERAEIFAGNLEEFLDQIDEKAGKTAVDRLETIRLQIKEDLSEVLVTREMFEERFKFNNDNLETRFNVVAEKFNAVAERFKSVDDRFASLEEHLEVRFNAVDEKFKSVDNRFKSLEENLEIRFRAVDDKFDAFRTEIGERFNTVDEKFKSLNFKFNILIALTIAALTMANPTFAKLLGKLF
jgi:predicted nuclease with TOPRIM domain